MFKAAADDLARRVVKNTDITDGILRNQALKAFAALTRHDSSALSANFVCGLTYEVKVDKWVLFLGFGKRAATAELSIDFREWSLDQLDEVLKPAAVRLMESA